MCIRIGGRAKKVSNYFQFFVTQEVTRNKKSEIPARSCQSGRQPGRGRSALSEKTGRGIAKSIIFRCIHFRVIGNVSGSWQERVQFHVNCRGFFVSWQRRTSRLLLIFLRLVSRVRHDRRSLFFFLRFPRMDFRIPGVFPLCLHSPRGGEGGEGGAR